MLTCQVFLAHLGSIKCTVSCMTIDYITSRLQITMPMRTSNMIKVTQKIRNSSVWFCYDQIIYYFTNWENERNYCNICKKWKLFSSFIYTELHFRQIFHFWYTCSNYPQTCTYASFIKQHPFTENAYVKPNVMYFIFV